MIYKCEHCDYSTKRLLNLRRHENRKYPCYKKKKEEPCNLEESENIRDLSSNILRSNVRKCAEGRGGGGRPGRAIGRKRKTSQTDLL